MGLTSVESKASSLAAFMNMLKSNVGTGVLSMPIAFSHAGWLLGLVTLPIFALFCTHAMFLLINAQKHICRKFSSSALSYEEVIKSNIPYLFSEELSPSKNQGRKFRKTVLRLKNSSIIFFPPASTRTFDELTRKKNSQMARTMFSRTSRRILFSHN